MRKEYSNALRKEFIRKIKENIPQFEEVKLKSYYLWPGERAFRWIPVDGLHCFIILSPNPKGLDEFMIELAWSKRSRFPELSMRPTGIPTIDHVEFERDEFDVTLSSICPNPEICWSINKNDFLQAGATELFISQQLEPVSPSEALLKVRPLVADAIDCLSVFGVPYFEMLVSHYKGEHV